MGIQYNNRPSVDLSGLWMSTPTLGIGYVIPWMDDAVVASVRWMHISNAGTSGNNQGQNQLQFMLSYRF
jgi:hypothetical protein